MSRFTNLTHAEHDVIVRGLERITFKTIKDGCYPVLFGIAQRLALELHPTPSDPTITGAFKRIQERFDQSQSAQLRAARFLNAPDPLEPEKPENTAPWAAPEGSRFAGLSISEHDIFVLALGLGVANVAETGAPELLFEAGLGLMKEMEPTTLSEEDKATLRQNEASLRTSYERARELRKLLSAVINSLENLARKAEATADDVSPKADGDPILN